MERIETLHELAGARKQHIYILCIWIVDNARPSSMMDSALLPVIRSDYPDATETELRRALDYLELKGLLMIKKSGARWELRMTGKGVEYVATPFRKKTLTVNDLMAKAFYPGRTRRSEAYKMGAEAKLRHAMEGLRIDCPFTEGSAKFDAFFSGIDEGRAIVGAQS